jgi:hypothetical protein
VTTAAAITALAGNNERDRDRTTPTDPNDRSVMSWR